MDIESVLAQAKDTITVRRVYGEPIERDGVLIIPAAGGGGGGGGGGGAGGGGDFGGGGASGNW